MRRVACMLLVMLLVSVACKRDHIYYSTSQEAVVRLNIDWSVSGFEANGVTVYIFDEDGNRVGSSILSSDPDVVNTTLPPGTYTIVVHNDSRAELDMVEFINTDNLSTFMVRSLEWTDHPYKEPDEGEFLAYEPNTMLAATVRNVVVEEYDVKYYYDKPDLADYQTEEVVEVYIVPSYIVHLAEVEAHIDGASSAIGIPLALLHGMSRGYYFGSEHTSEERVVEEFPMEVGHIITNSLRLLGDVNLEYEYEDYLYDQDDVHMEFSTFGLPFDIPDDGGDIDLDDMHELDPYYHSVYIELMLYMADGALYDLFVDVTDAVSVDESGQQVKYTIVIKDDLDNYEPVYDEDFEYDEDLSSGVFDPSVDEWVDVVVPLPM